MTMYNYAVSSRFSLSGIWHQTSTGWHVAVMNFGFLYSEDMSVCIGQKDRI